MTLSNSSVVNPAPDLIVMEGNAATENAAAFVAHAAMQR
jgi:hypothetical protein